MTMICGSRTSSINCVRFGNYIGDVEEESDEEEEIVKDDGHIAAVSGNDEDEEMEEDEANEKQAIVLHEDKQYYPSANEIFGTDVENVVQERDKQSLAEPLIAPIKTKKITVEEKDIPTVYYSREFHANLMNFPEQIRNVALVGHLHHGKTAFMDMLVKETHPDVGQNENKKPETGLRYTDTHVLEINRGLTVKSSPMSFLLQSGKGKSHLFNVIDTPGHVNFTDEVAAAGRLVDGFVVVLDVVEGVQINTKQVIQHAINEGLSLVLVLNKIDRLILDLKLPPSDAYYKMLHCIEEVNNFIKSIQPSSPSRLSPERGNVLFASAEMEWCFTLKSFSVMYQQAFPGIDIDEFSKRLWGNIFYNPSTRKFKKSSENGGIRSFVHFILEPIYKIYTHTIGENEAALKATLGKLGIVLKPSVYKLDVRPLLRIVCKSFFGDTSPFVDLVVSNIPSPVESARAKTEKTFTGPLDCEMAACIRNCDANGPLIINVTKLYPRADISEFYCLGRVLSGTLEMGQEVKVLGEEYTIDDEEDMAFSKVQNMWIPQTRYKVSVDTVPAGNLVLLRGVDPTVVTTATIISSKFNLDAYILKPLDFISEAVIKVAVEPINPSELPKMLEGLRKLNKTYPLLQMRVEESGEHIMLGSGELYMDCVLHDLRTLFAEMEIKVSDPVTRFAETCTERSIIKCYAETPNQKNKITMTAEPLAEGIAEDIESGKVDIRWPIKQVGKFFQENHDWDLMAARSIWAFGPDDKGPNILQDDTLPTEVDKRLLNSIRESMRQGFQWSVREGPLCEEPIRGVNFKIIDVDIAKEPIYRGGGQIIPTVRRVCSSSLLLASPRLLEPVYNCYITCPGGVVDIIYNLLTNRRGSVLSDVPIAGTPLYYVIGQVPVVDSFGFETDLRVASEGQAYVSMVFDRWQTVPGDPMDKDQKTEPLAAARPSALARDFVLKTRRRKGLSEEPTVTKFLDQSLVEQLSELNLLK
jgi:U5 small nuclear ribonucleoprotein component